MEGRDKPVLFLHLPLLSCQEVEDILMSEVCVGENVLLVLPGGVLFVGEDLYSYCFKLIPRSLLQFSLVYLSKATLSHLGHKQKLRLEFEAAQLHICIKYVCIPADPAL